VPGILRDTLTAAIVGGVLGVGLWVVSGMTNARWAQLLKRARLGLVGGLAGGGLGGLVGAVLYWLYFPRAIGWLIMGMGIGAAEGLYEHSRRKTRNGLIGGTVGGLLGGLLFGWIAQARLEMSGRATAFVVLGLCVGVLIGLAHVVLKEAWLTVLDGYRPGRQLILSKDTTTLGRAEHLALPFLGHADAELEPEHARILRQPDGQYCVEDNRTQIGTLVNSQPIHGPVVLRDNDLIKLGTNIVRFNHRRRDSHREGATAGRSGPGKSLPISPPPPPPVAFGRPTDVSTPVVPPIPPCQGTPEDSPAFEPDRQPANGSAWTAGAGPMRPPPPPPT
jgi:pSer/pThr/pTyr-binding forkhead associated (FHA) protein